MWACVCVCVCVCVCDVGALWLNDCCQKVWHSNLVLEIQHSLRPDHAFGTVFLHMSVNLICHWTPSAANWKRIWLFEAPALSDCCFKALCTNFLTYLISDRRRLSTEPDDISYANLIALSVTNGISSHAVVLAVRVKSSIPRLQFTAC